MKNARKEENKAISNSFSPSSTPIIAYSILGSFNLIENVRSNKMIWSKMKDRIELITSMRELIEKMQNWVKLG